jgi:5-hydroxyisourate hydrolase
MTTKRPPITTHILDVSLGKPARGVALALSRDEGGSWGELGRRETDADGRSGFDVEPLSAGTYRIRFEVGPYFEGGGRKGFYPFVEIVFRVESASEHYHVPLLLSPFGYSTYRGS